jgi:hypothetical protein
MRNGSPPPPGVNRVERAVIHSPTSSAEVKNEWSYTSTRHICLHGVDRNNFNFTDDETVSGRPDEGTM